MQMSTWACDHQFRRACNKIGALFQFVRYSKSDVLPCNNNMTRCVLRGFVAVVTFAAQNNTVTCMYTFFKM